MKLCKDINLSVKLFTEIGKFEYLLPDTVCKEFSAVVTNYTHPIESFLNFSFFGKTGLNQFTFSESEQENIFLYNLTKKDSDGNFLNATGILELYPSLSGLKTGNFITGIQITKSGLYSKVPTIEFASYSGIDSISVNELNLISDNAGDSFDLIFEGNGAGVSATAFTKKTGITLFTDQNPSHKFRTITGIIVKSGGHGFDGLYSVKMPEDITDYPKAYPDEDATSLGYSPVSFSTNFVKTAGESAGIAVLSSGSSGVLSGIIILGAGTGYKTGAIQFPKFEVIRSTEDIFRQNEAVFPETYKAIGVCILNTSGENMDFDKKFEFSYSRQYNGEYDAFTEFSQAKTLSKSIDFSKDYGKFYLKVKSKNSSVLADNFINYNFYETGTDKSGNSSFIRVVNNYTIEKNEIETEEGEFLPGVNFTL